MNLFWSEFQNILIVGDNQINSMAIARRKGLSMKGFQLESKWIQFSAMGLELGLSVIVGLLIGNFLDGQFGTEPWLLLLFLIFGLIAGFRSVFRLLKKLNSTENTTPS